MTLNDAGNSALHHRNKLHLKYIFIENSYFNITSLYCVFDQINGDLDVSNVYNVERK